MFKNNFNIKIIEILKFYSKFKNVVSDQEILVSAERNYFPPEILFLQEKNKTSFQNVLHVWYPNFM